MTKLDRSVRHAMAILARGDLASDTTIRDLLEVSTERRTLDLSDLAPADQAALIAERSQQLQPSADALAARIVAAAGAGRPFVAKFGIDPTGAEVHLGHAVPMLLLSRFQRMGHRVIFIVGDVTAKIGDPSGRSDERPALTDADIAGNLATYRDQVSPFFDFERAEFRHNGDWLRQVTLPRLIEITSKVPLSMSIQRDDFRTRLEAGHGLSLAELLYSVAMALDSVEICCDLEIGGIDQFLNMQMCRKIMEICGQEQELVAVTALLEGTDGSGAKMSKSRKNYVSLTAGPGEIFGKVMSVPDRLIMPYFRALTEWRDVELALITEHMADGSVHPMALKRLLAGDVAAAIHGVDAAMKARDEFAAQFSTRSFAMVDDLPTVADPALPVVEVVRALGFATSNGQVWRIAEQRGLRLVMEDNGGQDQVILAADEARQPLSLLAARHFGDRTGTLYLKAGRKIARFTVA